jgi:hypothetical protein
MLRDRGCAFPGCTRTRFLHAHHVQHWLHGGETSLDNVRLLCSFHHHLVHEGGWTIAVEADGALAFRSPAGRPLAPEPPRERIDNALGWLREWAQQRDLDLGPEVNAPQGDGTIPDCDLAASGLLSAG